MVEPSAARRYDTAPPIVGTGFRLSWGAVFAGLVVAITVQIVLTVLGAAIGLAAWEPGESARGLGIGAGIWAILSMLIALYIGGMTTGRLAGILTRKDGALHGVLLWGLSTIVTVWLLASGVTALAGGAFRMVGGVLGATSGAAAQAAGTAAARDDRGVERAGQRVEAAVERNRAELDTLGDTLRVRAGQVARGAEDVAGTGAWFALLALALSAAAAVAGAAKTAPR
jgi:hypothetical protein